MIPIIIDLVTKQHTKASDFTNDDLFWWADGDGSCDCNRALCFDAEVDKELEKQHGDHCYGSTRFVVVDVIDDTGFLKDNCKEQVVAEMNSEYDDKLIDEAKRIYFS